MSLRCLLVIAVFSPLVTAAPQGSFSAALVADDGCRSGGSDQEEHGQCADALVQLRSKRVDKRSDSMKSKAASVIPIQVSGMVPYINYTIDGVAFTGVFDTGSPYLYALTSAAQQKAGMTKCIGAMPPLEHEEECHFPQKGSYTNAVQYGSQTVLGACADFDVAIAGISAKMQVLVGDDIIPAAPSDACALFPAGADSEFFTALDPNLVFGLGFSVMGGSSTLDLGGLDSAAYTGVMACYPVSKEYGLTENTPSYEGAKPVVPSEHWQFLVGDNLFMFDTGMSPMSLGSGWIDQIANSSWPGILDYLEEHPYGKENCSSVLDAVKDVVIPIDVTSGLEIRGTDFVIEIGNGICQNLLRKPMPFQKPNFSFLGQTMFDKYYVAHAMGEQPYIGFAKRVGSDRVTTDLSQGPVACPAGF